MKQFDKAVVIGRFQPFHNGHAAMVRKALEEAKSVYILLGSAYAYPNVLNPLTARERQTMIFSWLNANFEIADVARVQFEHIPDYLYNEEKWKTSVRTAIKETKGDNIAIYGYEKDAGSYWLKAFGWTHVPVPPVQVDGKDLSATDLRPIIFNHKNGWDRQLSRYVPGTTVNYIDKWMMEDTFWRLFYEYEKWESELEKF